MSSSNQPSSVAAEISTIRRDFPQVKIQTATKDFLSASYQRTPSTKIKFNLTFPSEYPEQVLIIVITSDSVVPPGLKKKLEKDLSKDLPLLVGQYEQVAAVVRKLAQFVDGNKFLPCWKELKQSINLIHNSDQNNFNNNKNNNNKKNLKDNNSNINSEPKSTIQVLESKGKIKINLCRGKYHYQSSIIVDDGYPSTLNHEDWGKACVLKILSTNFPPKIETLLTTQARELIRRMQDGMPHAVALRMSNPMKIPRHLESCFGENNKKQEFKVNLTQTALKGLKKDTNTLSQVRDLRDVNSATTQGNARIKAHSAKTRRDARRAINKITDTEIAKDVAQQKKNEQWQIDEQTRMTGYNISEYDDSDPQPCLLSLVTFLKEKIQHLPEEKCPFCGELTLPDDPHDLKLLYATSSEYKTDKEKRARKAAKAARPVRTFCGCWYHHKCLNKFMTEPPFGEACPTIGCGRRVYHPDWPDDHGQLEQAWSRKQARRREMEDAALF